MSKIIIIVKGGVVQNVISTEDFVGDVFLVDYDELDEKYPEFKDDLIEPIFGDCPLERDNQKVEELLNMSFEEFLEENHPETLKEAKKELEEVEEIEYFKTLKRISD